MNNYIQLAVNTTTEAADMVSEVLIEEGSDGVVIYDRNDFNVSTFDYFDPKALELYADEVVVKGFFSPKYFDKKLEVISTRLNALREFFDCGSLKLLSKDVDGDEWLETWKQYFKPITIGKIVICPTWIPMQDEGRKILLLDNGLAFGTGQHETTSMLLDLMQNLSLQGVQTLDIGCGSGILGLASVMLGATHSVLIDNDVQATQAACHNAELNSLADKVTVITGNLVDAVKSKYKVIFANLTADILLTLSCDINSVAESNASLLLSGILNDRCKEVLDCYQSKNYKLIKKVTIGEWTALYMRGEQFEN